MCVANVRIHAFVCCKRSLQDEAQSDTNIDDELAKFIDEELVPAARPGLDKAWTVGLEDLEEEETPKGAFSTVDTSLVLF